MASINASTAGAGGIITTADNTGTLNIQSGGATIATISSTGLAVASGKTLSVNGTTVPSNIPAFSAYRSSNQSFSYTAWTKIALNGEDFDTNNNFDNATNYRFTPTVAGYYQFNGVIPIQSASSLTRTIVALWKNNAQALRGSDLPISAGTQVVFANVQGLFYMNGSTDYMELYVYAQGSGSLNVIANSGEYPTLSGYLARAA